MLADFHIIGTEVEGQNLSPSLTATFGTINPGEIAQGRWLFLSSIQGQFIDYQATFENVDANGDKRLSLVKSVDIHELIHLVTATGTFNDGKYDYLVNDLPDANDTPDTLWLSDGSVMPVKSASGIATDGLAVKGDLEVKLTATVGNGWNYFDLIDPGRDLYRLVRVLRSDGVEVPIGDNITGGNAWQTDRTFIENGHRPINENKLHLLDYGGTGQYTLVYAPMDAVGPTVASISSPAAIEVSAVDNLTVAFSENIDASTLTVADLRLTRNGSSTNLITAAANIVAVDGRTFRIQGLNGLTNPEGSYRLEVSAADVKDEVGNSGSGLLAVDWLMAATSPAVTSIDGVENSPRNSAVSSVTVNFNMPVQLNTFEKSDLVLKRNGVTVPLTTTALTFTQSGPSSYEISGLGSVTTIAGDYSLTVNATGVHNSTNVAGIGSLTATWIMDASAPTISGLAGLPTGATRIAGDSADITFSEALDESTFTIDDLRLTRNGTAVDSSSLTLSRLTSTVYRVSGFSALTASDGTYVLSLASNKVKDIAGNAGTGTLTHQWVMDTAAPNAATNLIFSPDTGTAGDLVVNVLTGTLSGKINQAGVIVELFDETTLQELGRATVSGTSFSKTLSFAVAGNHRVRVRVTDTAGNSTDGFLNLFIDQSLPTVDRFVGIPATATAAAPNTIDVVFTEPFIASSLRRSNLKLTRNGGIDLLPANVVFTQTSPTTLRISGLSGLVTPDGAYELTIATTGVLDLAGNSGFGNVTANWSRLVQPAPTGMLRGFNFNDVNRNKTRDAGEAALPGWTVFIDANRNGSLDPGERSTITNSWGEYIFDRLAPGEYVIAQVLKSGWTQTFPEVLLRRLRRPQAKSRSLMMSFAMRKRQRRIQVRRRNMRGRTRTLQLRTSPTFTTISGLSMESPIRLPLHKLHWLSRPCRVGRMRPVVI
ncbi:MAG: Ig-like domain-containing protein [Planctomycetaceae bacterium]